MVFYVAERFLYKQNLNIFLNFDFKSSLSHENIIFIFTEEKT